MAGINLGSDLLETTFTPEEQNQAMQLMDKGLSLAYLQNSRVQIFRELVSLTFDDSERDTNTIRAHAYLRGKLDVLDQLITGALEPTPVPINPENAQQSSL